MSSLAELPELVGFFSYSREDDEAFRGMLSALRDAIQRELSAQLGRSKKTFRLWQDQTAIAPGKLWESEIKTAIDGSFFFIPIVTPRSVSSKYCKIEFDSFLAREKAIGRSDLVFPILYISVAALENEAKWRDDVVLSTIGRRQYVDWRPLRHLDIQTTAVREQIERLCQKIVEALNESWTPPEERRRMEEAEARQRAEEEARRLEAEAKLRAEEEQHRKQAEAEARWRAAEERKRQKAEAKRLADEEERRKRAEAEVRRRAEEEHGRQEAEAKPQSKKAADALVPRVREALGDEAVGTGRWRVRAAISAAAIAMLLLIGWGGYAFFRHTVERGVQQAELKREEERKAAEAEANRKLAQTEQERLAAPKAEQERQARAAAEQARAAAEAQEKRKVTEAEGMHRQSWIGVIATSSASFGSYRARGVLVMRGYDKGPAMLAGIEQGDVIIKFDGHEINEAQDLARIVTDTSIDKNVQVVILRNGKEYTKTLKIGALSAEAEANRKADEPANEAIKQARAALNSGAYDRAIADYDQAIRLDPNNAASFHSRGVTYRRKGDTDRAIADYDQAIRLLPTYTSALINRAYAYESKGDHDRAFADYNEAIRLDPKHAIALCYRGKAKLKINDTTGNEDIAQARQLDASVCP